MLIRSTRECSLVCYEGKLISCCCFCRNPERYDERPIAGDVENLLCDHKKFKYPIELVEKLKNDLQEFVSSPEADRVHM